jgi:glycosyltransferase involved in cell wall biosynthesis
MRVFIADNQMSGHHKTYIDILKKNEFVVDISININFENSKKRIIRYIYDRWKYLYDVKKNIDNQKNTDFKILHFLYFDNLYVIPIGFILKTIPAYKVVTLHHVPINKFKKLMLKISCRFIDKIVVHSEILKNELNKINIKKVHVIEYPSYYNYKELKDRNIYRKKNDINNKQIVVSALGGTRYDKGLDILLEAVSMLDGEMRSRIVINIAGKEEYFKRDYINKISSEKNLKIRILFGYLSDLEFMENVILSDIVVLPYRRTFYGNSGPMTEAIKNKIPVIASDNDNFKFYIDKYNAGEIFNAESHKDLACILQKTIYNIKEDIYYVEHSKKELNNQFSVAKFIYSHRKLYEYLSDFY